MHTLASRRIGWGRTDPGRSARKGEVAVEVDLWETAISAVWLAVGASIVGLVIQGVRRGTSLVLAQESRIRNASLRDAVEYATAEAERAAETVVTGLNQSVVSQMKSQGRWDATAAAATKKQAMQLLERTLSADAKATLTRGGADLQGYLSSMIEAKVASAPNRRPARHAAQG